MAVNNEVSVQKRFVKSLEEPPISRFLFSDVRLSWLWLVIRLYAGYTWLMAGLGKVSNPAWTGSKAGAALSGFIGGALQKTAGEHPDVQGYYAWFLNNLVMPFPKFWSYLIAYGEVLVGIALIIGIFTGVAALFGLFMNLNYLFAGTVSVNPPLALLSLFLFLAWRTAGWLGLDRWVLPALGTPWRPGLVFRGEKEPVAGLSPQEGQA